MSSFEETFATIQKEEQERGMRFVALNLRKLLAGALCAACGEPLGNDDDIDQNAKEETCHARCITEKEDDDEHDAPPA